MMKNLVLESGQKSARWIAKIENVILRSNCKAAEGTITMYHTALSLRNADKLNLPLHSPQARMLT